MKVLGVGWAKTGTTSLGECFRILGFDHQSQDLDLAEEMLAGRMERLMDVAARKDSFEDWPWLLLFREFDEAFPDCRFVLTERRPEAWLRSYRNMIDNLPPPSERMNRIRAGLYGLPFPDPAPEALVERYLAHNAAVRQYFEGRPDRLLCVDWEAGDGWHKLCGFLGRDIPQVAFPHANKGRYDGPPVPQRPRWRRAVSALRARLRG